MILTYKIKHNKDFSKELNQAKKVAEYSIENRGNFSSSSVRHIGLKSAISNQILRKYGKNWGCKSIKSVNLTIPNQSIKIDKDNRKIKIPCLKLELDYYFSNDFSKINQIEIDKTNAYISCNFEDEAEKYYVNNLGVDLNTTGHCSVVSIPHTGKVHKLGKKAYHIHNKYKNMRRKLQKGGKYKKIKKIKNRESRIVRDINHKVSKRIIELAEENKCNIKLENLKNIRKKTKNKNNFNYALNSWSFYQLQKFIEYKAKKRGIKIIYIEPYNTSKSCSRCGLIGDRIGKLFKCPYCGHVDNADVNAGFNIACRQESIYQSNVDRDTLKGSTDIPKVAMDNCVVV